MLNVIKYMWIYRDLVVWLEICIIKAPFINVYDLKHYYWHNLPRWSWWCSWFFCTPNTFCVKLSDRTRSNLFHYLDLWDIRPELFITIKIKSITVYMLGVLGTDSKESFSVHRLRCFEAQTCTYNIRLRIAPCMYGLSIEPRRKSMYSFGVFSY